MRLSTAVRHRGKEASTVRTHTLVVRLKPARLPPQRFLKLIDLAIGRPESILVLIRAEHRHDVSFLPDLLPNPLDVLLVPLRDEPASQRHPSPIIHDQAERVNGEEEVFERGLVAIRTAVVVPLREVPDVDISHVDTEVILAGFTGNELLFSWCTRRDVKRRAHASFQLLPLFLAQIQLREQVANVVVDSLRVLDLSWNLYRSLRGILDG